MQGNRHYSQSPGLVDLFPPEPNEDARNYEDRIKALCWSVERAVHGYERELEVLKTYAPGSPNLKKLREFVEGRRPFTRLPLDIQNDLRDRWRCSLVPIGEEDARDGGPPWPVLRVVGDPIEAIDAAVRYSRKGFPRRPTIEDEEALRERAREFLARPIATGRRLRPSEAALLNLLRNLAFVWLHAVGGNDKGFKKLFALKTRAPKQNPGRPEDAALAHRRAFVLGVLSGFGIPRPSARILRHSLPPLSPKTRPPESPK